MAAMGFPRSRYLDKKLKPAKQEAEDTEVPAEVASATIVLIMPFKFPEKYGSFLWLQGVSDVWAQQRDQAEQGNEAVGYLRP